MDLGPDVARCGGEGRSDGLFICILGSAWGGGGQGGNRERGIFLTWIRVWLVHFFPQFLVVGRLLRRTRLGVCQNHVSIR